MYLVNDYVKKWNIEHGGSETYTVFLIMRLYTQGFTEWEIQMILKTLDEVCPVCWGHPVPCFCSNDE